VQAYDLLPGMGDMWNNIFTLALNPSIISTLTIPSYIVPSQWAAYALEVAGLFNVQQLSNGQLNGSNPGFVYDPTTGRLGYSGQMAQSTLNALGPPGQPVTILHLVNGQPEMDSNGHLLTDTVYWAPPTDVQTLFTASQGTPSPVNGQLGYRLGGPGLFDITADTIDLGNCYGILSCGVADTQGGTGRYGNLASLMSGPTTGATLNVTVTGADPNATTSALNMLTSTIAAVGGGDVNVTCTAGSMNLGSQELFNTKRQVGFGVFTSGNKGNVNVTALGDI
jgi:hypothetical protein